jgi:Protein of unknown function (DUF3108)
MVAMRKVYLFSFSLALLTVICAFHATDSYRRVVNDSFGPGEVLRYRVHYGFINAGEAEVKVSNQIHKVNERPCYEVTAFGKSVGAFDWVIRIRDTWRSYIDTSALVPQRFHTNVQEGKYRKEETVHFNYQNRVIRSEEKNDESKEFDMPQNVQDILSGYCYLRTIDFNQLRLNETVPIPAFFDDKLYDFKIRYRGREEISTKFGKIRCIKIAPVMPKNEMFDGESSIRVWITDDKNRIPVKIEADMFMGAIAMDLKDFKGLKQKPAFQ